MMAHCGITMRTWKGAAQFAGSAVLGPMRTRVFVKDVTTVLGGRTNGNFTLDAVLLMAVSSRSDLSAYSCKAADMLYLVYRLPFDDNKKSAAPTRSRPRYGVEVAAEVGAGAAAGPCVGKAVIDGAGPAGSTAYVSV